jgi:Antitoxin SocA-like, Panacea domain
MKDDVRNVVRYIPSVAKALEVILWIAERRRGIDLIHLVKSAFYADKYHVARYGRPITGDIYRAAWFGPLPQVIYGLLRHEPMEMLALGINGPLPFKIDGAYRIDPERSPNMSKLSESDIEALEIGLKEVDGTSFDELVAKTHGDPAYQNAVAGAMDYRDFIPQDDPKRKEKISYLEEVAPFAVF